MKINDWTSDSAARYDLTQMLLKLVKNVEQEISLMTQIRPPAKGLTFDFKTFKDYDKVYNYNSELNFNDTAAKITQ